MLYEVRFTKEAKKDIAKPSKTGLLKKCDRAN